MIRNDYTEISIIISKNGSIWEEKIIDGRVYDKDRNRYLNSYLEVVDILKKTKKRKLLRLHYEYENTKSNINWV